MRRNPFDFAGRQAYLYVRVSTTDQAEHGYSVGDQRALLTSWAGRSGVGVAGVFVDDKSAKASDEVGASFTRRPGWRALVAAVEATPPAAGGPDLVLVKDWSRFGRDTASALLVSAQLRGFGVEVQAVTQLVDYANPTSLFQVLIPLATAEVENRQRSINVRRGMRRALREGRWMGGAPIGYQNARDAENRPVIVPDPVRGPLVAAAFELAADGHLPVAEVYRRARRNGLDVARSRFYRMLRDEVYVGRITVEAWPEMGEPEEDVPALHEPIVSELTFARVQRRFDPDRADRRRRGERGPDLRFPLRGVLLCPRCGLPVTTDVSKGRSRTYTYYTCHRHRSEPAPDRFKYRHRAGAVHEAMGAHLGRVQISPAARALALAVAEEAETEGRAAARRRRSRLDAQLAEAEQRRDRVEDRYADGDLDRDAFRRMSARYDAEVERLRGQLDAVRAGDPAEDAARVRDAVRVMTDLRGIWERAGADGERGAEAQAALAGSIYPDGAVFDGGAFRTAVPSVLIGLLGGETAENGTAGPPEGAGRPAGYAREDSNL